MQTKETLISLKGIDISLTKFNEEGLLTEGGPIKDLRVCIRPGLSTLAFRSWSEKYKDKIVSHNYGHAGLGFCLSWGSTKRAIENFENLAGNIPKDEEITIVGLGVNGLTTAINLHSKGYRNVKLIGEEFGDKLPSFGAGALVHVCFNELPKDPQHRRMFHTDFGESCIQFRKIAEGKHEYVKKGVRPIDYYTDEDFEANGLQHFLRNEVIGFPKLVDVKFEAHDHVFKLYQIKTYHVITPVYMNHLFNIVEKLKFPITFGKVYSLEEIQSRFIFNCTGIGAKILARDNKVIPITGHSISLNIPNPQDFGYIINFNNLGKLGIKNIDGSMYFMPKVSGFVGGTFQMGYDGSDKKLNGQLTTKLINNARFVFHGIIPEKEISVSMIPKL